MTTRLMLICHGATAATRLARFPHDEELDGGRAKMTPPDVTLKGDRWLAGPETRAQQTAMALSGEAAVVCEPRLRAWDCGTWAGRDIADLQRAEPEALLAWMSDPAAAPHGGESLLDLLGRIEHWMEAEGTRGGRPIAVSHPAVLRAAVVHALGSGPSSFWRIDAKPSCRVRLGHDGRRWVLQSLGPS